jgi:hypothetical protein
MIGTTVEMRLVVPAPKAVLPFTDLLLSTGGFLQCSEPALTASTLPPPQPRPGERR